MRVTNTFGADIYPKVEYIPPECANECEEEWQNSKVDYIEIETFRCIIGLPDCSVDLVTCIMSMHHFRDFNQMLIEIRRVMKPGGYLFFREHDVSSEDFKLI